MYPSTNPMFSQYVRFLLCSLHEDRSQCKAWNLATKIQAKLVARGHLL